MRKALIAAFTLCLLLTACAPGGSVTPTGSPRNPPTLAAPGTTDLDAPRIPITAQNSASLMYLGRLTQPADEPPASLFQHAIDPSGTRLIALSDSLMFGWSLETGALLFSTSRLDMGWVFFGTPESGRAYGVTTDGTVIVFDAETGAGIDNFPGIPSMSGVLAHHPARGLLALGGLDGSVKIWDVLARRALATIDLGDRPISALVFLPDGESLLAASGETVRHLRIADRALLAERTLARISRITRIAVSPDGSRAALATDLNVTLWSPASPDQTFALDVGSGGASQGVVFSSDGAFVAAGSQVSGWTIWGIGGQQMLARLPGTDGRVNGVFIPGAPLLLTTGIDRSVSLWNAALADSTSIPQAELNVGTRRIVNAAWTADASRLLLFDAGGAVYVWGVGAG
jgi:WD40 repeat protein